MAGFSFTSLVTKAASAVNTFLFGKDDDNGKPRPSPDFSLYSSSKDWLPHQSSDSSYTRDSYVRDNTAGRSPVTSDYGRSFYDSKQTSSHAGASARTHAFYQPSSAPSRSQTTTTTAARNHRLYDSNPTPSPTVQSRRPASNSAHTQASYQPSLSPDSAHRFYGSSLTPSPAIQSRQPAPTSAHARASYQRSPSPDPTHRPYDSSLTSSPAVQSRQPTLTCACGSHQFSPDPPHRVYGSSPAPSPAVQPRQPTSTSSYAQASYQRPPDSDPDPAHIFKSYQSSPTYPRTPSSPPAYLQAATDMDEHRFTQVVQPSLVPADLSDSESDEIESIEDVDIGKELRNRARRQHREMRDARAQAKSARKRGDDVAENRHEKEAIMRENAVDQLNERAAKIIFHHKNKGHKEGTVDLHGLYVQEAIRYAKQELKSASQRDDVEVRFIVGKGLHAEDGRAKIRPALEKLCNERGLTYSLDPRNAGVLIVQLD